MSHFVELVQNFESLNTKMTRLKRKMVDLESREEDVNRELNYAESLLMKKRRRTVVNWLASIGATKERVQQLENQVEEARAWSTFGQLPKTIDKVTEEVKELIQVGVFSRGLTLDAEDNQGFPFLTAELVGQKFEDNKNMIREYLRDDKFLSIGVYGMGGVGKTTLVTHIYNELLTREDTSVFWVTVSQNFSIHKLQNDIARVLRIDLKAIDDERIKAAILAKALRRRNNYVIILDDLWDVFPPMRAGIISGVGCKLIITTRSMDVCHGMHCHAKIALEPLSKEEGWTLFMKTLGGGTTLTPEIEKIAKSLAKECAGLPLGIVTVAGSMTGVDDIREWSNALEKMRQSTAGQDEKMQLDKVFHALRYSYDALKDSQLQECFLYCSLFPEDEEIIRDNLIVNFIDEGLIKRMRSRQAEYNRGHTILNKLERACLLESCTDQYSKMKYVKMHDLVRDMALRIASESSRFLVEVGVNFVAVIDERKWSVTLERASFMKCHRSPIHSHASPKCPKLSTLLLRSCLYITTIPDSFFMHLTALTVLDLSYTGIEILPSSISNLKSLSALLLEGCGQIKMEFPISELGALKRLDLSYSEITELPQGMEMLIHLRDLNLCGANNLQTIPEGVLSKLSNLQCLELPTYNGRVKVRAKEIASLQKLETFKGRFHNINEFDTYLRSWEDARPNQYKLLVGDGYHRFYFPDNDVENSVSISRCHNFDNLCDFQSLRNTSDMRKCYVEDCNGMTHVFCQACYDLPFVQSLQSLHLNCLSNLCDLILRGSPGVLSSSAPAISRLPIGTFSSLKAFKIGGCNKMKKLFRLALLSHLENLETLEVDSCNQLEEIVGDDDLDEEATATTFPKLKEIRWSYLPKLKSFCSNRKIVSDSLEDVDITECHKLERFPLLTEEPQPPTSLRKITVDKEWWESVEFDHPNTKESLRPICEFRTSNRNISSSFSTCKKHQMMTDILQ